MEIDGQTRLAAVIANPINHSLSPFIHNLAFNLTNTKGVYLAFTVEQANLKASLDSIKALNMYGVNVSMPYKREIIPYLDELSEDARLIGAVNTIVFKDDKLQGCNTDGSGFVKSLGSYELDGKNMLILGGGGASLAIIVASIKENIKTISVFNRKSDHFIDLSLKLRELSEKMEVEIKLFDLADKEQLDKIIQQSDLLVNATSVGMDGVSLPLPKETVFPKDFLLVDIIYKPLKTPLLKLGENQGIKTMNGLAMLVNQAAQSFKMWTGKEMPVDIIEERLEKRLK